MVCEIPLANSKGVALVDDSDYAELSGYRWHLRAGIGPQDRDIYAVRGVREAGKVRQISMHRQIMDFPTGIVDHRNGSGLDNQRANLRAVDNSLNGFNRQALGANNTSGATGVSWDRSVSKWRVQINQGGTQKTVGYYTNMHAAVVARHAAELLHYGEASPATAAWLAKHDLVLAA